MKSERSGSGIDGTFKAVTGGDAARKIRKGHSPTAVAPMDNSDVTLHFYLLLCL
jgi:hypothetical protein